MVDFHLWPFFERAPAVGEILHVEMYPNDKYPQLNKWIRSMEENDAVKKVRLPNELHRRFLVTVLEGNPQYDIDLN
jgi:glutathione S-transferase